MSVAANTLELSFQRDRDEFIGKLQEFHALKGNAFVRIPTFGGQALDLYALYNTVVSYGGVDEVTKKSKWGQVFNTLGYPPCTNADFALKQHYSRFLEAYEKMFFLGEDGDDRLFPDKFRGQKNKRLSKPSKPGILGESRSHNFDRIMLSLQSGLENEVDFALNICALLSNVTNSIFNLAKNCGILDLILAHGGLWCTENSFDRELCTEWCSRSGKNFTKFWNNAISDTFLKKLYNELYSMENDHLDENGSKFFVYEKSQEKSPEFARILQISLILYNFSFEQINAMFLAQHATTERFLLFASCSTYSNIKKTCLDTLDNISEYVVLNATEDLFTQQILRVLHSFIISKDRFQRIRAKSILAKLARKENAKIIAENLSPEIFKTLLDTISLPDISLVLTSLDALFSLSGLCESTATSICSVQGGVNLLASLLTLRAESYGNQAIKGFRIVENKSSMFTSKNQAFLQSHYERSYTNEYHAGAPAINMIPQTSLQIQPPHSITMLPDMSRLPSYHGLPQMPQLHPQLPSAQTHSNLSLEKKKKEFVEVDPETFAVHWMSAYYEPNHSSKLLISTIYADYDQICRNIGRKGILSLEGFQTMLRAILPPHLAQIVLIDSNGTLGVSGIQRKSIPSYVQSVIFKSNDKVVAQNGPSCLSQSETCKKMSTTNENENNLVPIQLGGNDEKSITGERRLMAGEGCQELVEKLKIETEGHFMQFHLHRQHLQALQMQIHQLMQTTNVENVPAMLIKDVQIRAQTHQQQMQMHYQKLLQLTALTEQVQKKMIQQDDESIEILKKEKGSCKTSIDKDLVSEQLGDSEKKEKLENSANKSECFTTDKKTSGQPLLTQPVKLSSLDSQSLVSDFHLKNENTIQPSVFASIDQSKNYFSPNHSPINLPRRTKGKKSFVSPSDNSGLTQISKSNRSARISRKKYNNHMANGFSPNGFVQVAYPVSAMLSNISPQQINQYSHKNSSVSATSVNQTSCITAQLNPPIDTKLNFVDMINQTRNSLCSKLNKTTQLNTTEVLKSPYRNANSKEFLSTVPSTLSAINIHQRNGDSIYETQIKSNIPKLEIESDIDDVVDFERVCETDHSSSKALTHNFEKKVNQKEIINSIKCSKDLFVQENGHDKAANLMSKEALEIDKIKNDICLKSNHKDLNSIDLINSKVMQLDSLSHRSKQSNGIEIANDSFNKVTTSNDSFDPVLKSKDSPRVNCLGIPFANSNLDTAASLNVISNCTSTPQTSFVQKDYIQTSNQLNKNSDSNNLIALETCRGTFKCEWHDCHFSFLCESQLFEHMVMFHAPSDGKVLHCNVAGCSSSQMLRGSFIVHLQEVHFSCSSSTGYWKIEHENESPVTRSIRFTAALILRNISRNSPSAKSLLLCHEELLARVAMSTSEAATAASQCLFELHKIVKREAIDFEDLEHL